MAEESNNPPTSETPENVTEDVNIVTEDGGGAPIENKVDDASMELDASGGATKRAREENEEDPQHKEGSGDGPSKKPRLDNDQNGEEEPVKEDVRMDTKHNGKEEPAKEDVRQVNEHNGEEEPAKEDARVDTEQNVEEPVKEDVGAGEEEEGAEEDAGLQKGGEGDDGGEENECGDGGEAKKEEEKKVGPVKLGPKTFNTAVEMFDYFYNFLHHWPLNVNVNKYEHMVLLDLLIKGHHESDKKVGPGVETFQVRVHPMWESRCYCLIRKDDTVDDFSYRKCVDSLLPLPENMKVSGKPNFASNNRRNNKQSKQGHQGGWGGGRGGGGRGRGRHGRGRGPSRG